MKRSFFLIAGNKVLLCFLLAGIFILAGTSYTAAQDPTTMANSYTGIAQKFSVTAYPHNTFDKAETVALLQQMIAPLQSIIANGGGTDSQKATHAYLSAVLNDITKYSIAPENTLLTRLESVQMARLGSVQNGGPTAQLHNNVEMVRNLYNQIVSQLL